MDDRYVRRFSSLGPDYEQAFATFLAHTDQKVQAREWLGRSLQTLGNRRVFIDAGAGTGTLAASLGLLFQRTIAIEPNPDLRLELAARCPTALILPAGILEAQPDAEADLILLSHVLYYIPVDQWRACLDRLASWLAPRGKLVIILQNRGTDCMRLVWDLMHQAFDLRGAVREFAREQPEKYQVAIDLVPSEIRCPDLQTACTIAEFMLNLAEAGPPVPFSQLEAAVKSFEGISGGYSFTCSQDCVTITRTA